MSQQPKIAIIGAGPGGLTLARILHINGIQTTVFDRDLHALSRPQGGSLDMHPETGQYAIAAAKLEQQFRKMARYCDQGNKVYRPDGELLFEDPNPDGNRPEIDRTHLRQMLIDSLPTNTIRWGKKINSVRPLPNGGYVVGAGDGEGGAYDLVVGADGAWSRVRSLVSSTMPYYEGVIVADLSVDDVDRQHPKIAALVGNGKFFAKGIGKTLAGQRNANGHVRVYAALRVDETAVVLDPARPDIAKREILDHFVDFAPIFRDLIGLAEFNAVRPMYALPVGHRWSNRPGITLIGDAAHVMSPFGGEGANGAMADAADLALAVARSPDWRQSVADFEQIMFQRAEEAARGAAAGLRGAVAFDAPDHVLQHIASATARLAGDSPREAIGPTPNTLLTTRIAALVSRSDNQRFVDASYRFDLSGPNGGAWIVDFRKGTAGVRRSEENGQCNISMTDDNFVALVQGLIDTRTAFMTGVLKVSGDMDAAMKLGPVLSA